MCVSGGGVSVQRCGPQRYLQARPNWPAGNTFRSGQAAADFCFTGLAGNNQKNLGAGVNNHLSQPQKYLNIEQSLSALAHVRSIWMPETHQGRNLF